MAQHKCHDRFQDDSFTFDVLEISESRDYIEQREEFYIQKYNTHTNGLNDTPHGKGHSNTSKFSTLGYEFNPESREKMSNSAKKYCEENPDRLKKLRDGAAKMWADPEMRKHHSDIRKGKRLRPTVISDEDVDAIRYDWSNNQDYWEKELHKLKAEGYSYRKAFSIFVDYYANKHNVSTVLIRNIIKKTMRKEVYPSIKDVS